MEKTKETINPCNVNGTLEWKYFDEERPQDKATIIIAYFYDFWHYDIGCFNARTNEFTTFEDFETIVLPLDCNIRWSNFNEPIL